MTAPLKRIYALRVHRKYAGKSIAFDKIYLFLPEDEQLISRMFRDALVLPLNDSLVFQLKAVLGPDKRVETKAYGYRRGSQYNFRAQMKKHTTFDDLKADGRLAVIPTLFTYRGVTGTGHKRKKVAKKGDNIYPAYLVAGYRDENLRKLATSALNHKAYYILNRQKIGPVCLACPRHQMSLTAGECQFGEDVCYTHLAQVRPGDIDEGIKRYEAFISGGQDPEVEGLDTCHATEKPE